MPEARTTRPAFQREDQQSAQLESAAAKVRIVCISREKSARLRESEHEDGRPAEAPCTAAALHQQLLDEDAPLKA